MNREEVCRLVPATWEIHFRSLRHGKRMGNYAQVPPLGLRYTI
jgi:hypothetical protein